MKALVLDGDGRAALAMVRSLGGRGIEVIVASHAQPCLAGCSRWCADRFVYPSPVTSPAFFAEWLTSTLQEVPDALLYTSSDLTTSIAGKRRLSLPRLATKLFPPQRSLEIAMDKSATLDLASCLGIQIPRSVQFTREQPLDVTHADISYPVAVKASQSDLPYRTDTIYAQDQQRLRLAVAETLRESPSALAQEVVTGRGTAIFALFDSGEPVVTFAHRRLREKPPWGGVSVLSESIEPPAEMLDRALRLLRELHWHGVAMVEFKLNSVGEPVLMEINPRFWGSLELAVKSGMDFPYFAFQLASGENVRAPRPRHAVNRWLLGDMDSLMLALRFGPAKQRALAPLRRVWDMRYGPCFEVERVSDPRPALYEYSAWLKMAIRRVRSGLKGDASRCGKLGAHGG